MLKNITLSAEGGDIEKARLRALGEKSTLNQAFRDWLRRYSGKHASRGEYRDLMAKFDYVSVGRKFSRDEMNAR